MTNSLTWFQSVQRRIGRYAKRFLPYLSVPAPVKPEVLRATLDMLCVINACLQDLSHDPIRNLVLEDPLVKQLGTVSGLTDMFDGVRLFYPSVLVL